MKRFLFVSGVFFLSFFANAQLKGKTFPAISGEILATEKFINIPEDTKGKYTLIAMAYSKGAEKDLETWLQPSFDKFIAKTGMWDAAMDVNLYFIPMFTGVNKATAGTARKKIKEKTDKQLLPHILFYVGELETYRDELDFEKRDTPYFFVIDKNGKIVHAVSGAYSEQKMEAIEDIILD
ncbi:MAG: hypothetical protein ACR2GN_10165 [Bacteroidia bacterium]